MEKKFHLSNQVNLKSRRMPRVHLKCFNTPVRNRYATRINEGFDVEGKSPCFDVFKKLHNKAFPPLPVKETNIATGLELLAEAAMSQNLQQIQPLALEPTSEPNLCSTQSEDTPKPSSDLRETNDTSQPGPSFTPSEQSSQLSLSLYQSEDSPSTSSTFMSPILAESLAFPKATETSKPKRVTMTDIIPDHLTSTESIRKFSLKQLDKIKSFAEREKKAKVAFLKRKITASKKCAKAKGKVAQSKSKKGKRPLTETEKLEQAANKTDGDTQCEACHMTWEEDQETQMERTWVQCDNCDNWMHSDCLSYEFDENEPFLCPKCFKN